MASVAGSGEMIGGISWSKNSCSSGNRNLDQIGNGIDNCMGGIDGSGIANGLLGALLHTHWVHCVPVPWSTGSRSWAGPCPLGNRPSPTWALTSNAHGGLSVFLHMAHTVQHMRPPTIVILTHTVEIDGLTRTRVLPASCTTVASQVEHHWCDILSLLSSETMCIVIYQCGTSPV